MQRLSPTHSPTKHSTAKKQLSIKPKNLIEEETDEEENKQIDDREEHSLQDEEKENQENHFEIGQVILEKNSDQRKSLELKRIFELKKILEITHLDANKK
jgi:hypothetical protein